MGSGEDNMRCIYMHALQESRFSVCYALSVGCVPLLYRCVFGRLRDLKGAECYDVVKTPLCVDSVIDYAYGEWVCCAERPRAEVRRRGVRSDLSDMVESVPLCEY
jgi:hypothetical protein